MTEEEAQYDIQVRSETTRQVSDYTFNQRHSTTALTSNSTYQCGNPFNIVAPTMTTPLQHMNVGDIFQCVDFDHVLVREVTKLPEPGGFSGVAFARVNGFNRANLAVRFSGTFNSESQMVTGKMTFISQPLSNMSKLIEEMKKIGEAPPVLDSIASENPDLENADTPPVIIVSGRIDSLFINNEGQLIAIKDGVQDTVMTKAQIGYAEDGRVIIDDHGNQYKFENGTVSKELTPNAAQPRAISTDSLNNFELLVKRTIDSVYALCVQKRDSIKVLSSAKMKQLQEKVAIVDNMEQNVEDGDILVQGIDSKMLALFEEIPLLDSIIYIEQQLVLAIENDLTELNNGLEKIKDYSESVKNAIQWQQQWPDDIEKLKVFEKVKSDTNL